MSVSFWTQKRDSDQILLDPRTKYASKPSCKANVTACIEYSTKHGLKSQRKNAYNLCYESAHHRIIFR